MPFSALADQFHPLQLDHFQRDTTVQKYDLLRSVARYTQDMRQYTAQQLEGARLAHQRLQEERRYAEWVRVYQYP